MNDQATAPAGRLWRGLPPETRHEQQQQRLIRAAAAVAVRAGYTATTVDAISREAQMSKATFYVHYGNKEDCFLAMFDLGISVAVRALVEGARDAGPTTRERQRGGLRGFLGAVEREPEIAQAVLVEAVHAGPRIAARREEAVTNFAQVMFQETLHAAEHAGGRRFATVYDAVGIAGAVVELTTRHLRTGLPETIDEIADAIERLLSGVLVPVAPETP